MAEGRRWTREELLIVLNLYEKLQFGQFHSKQPVIIEVAARMNRTPGSVAMKLSNLASLDPKLRARSIVGLEGASNLDREVWEEFRENRDVLVPASEEAMRKLFERDGARRSGYCRKRRRCRSTRLISSGRPNGLYSSSECKTWTTIFPSGRAQRLRRTLRCDGDCCS